MKTKAEYEQICSSQSEGREVYLTLEECRKAQDGSVVWDHDGDGYRRGEPIGIKECRRKKLFWETAPMYDLLSLPYTTLSVIAMQTAREIDRGAWQKRARLEAIFREMRSRLELASSEDR